MKIGQKLSCIYHQISSNTHLISSCGAHPGFLVWFSHERPQKKQYSSYLYWLEKHWLARLIKRVKQYTTSCIDLLSRRADSVAPLRGGLILPFIVQVNEISVFGAWYDLRLCFRHISWSAALFRICYRERTIPLLPKSEILSLKPLFCSCIITWTWSEGPKTSFLLRWLVSFKPTV